MNDQSIGTATPRAAAAASAAQPRSLFPVAGSWQVASGVAAVMVLLALLGVGLTTTSSTAAPAYWVSLVPVYGVLCMGTAWARARHGDGARRLAVFRQLFHWLGIGIALSLDFVVRGTGEETGTASGLNALLVLALGCYLAGVHLEGLFAVVGVLLTLTLIVVAKAEQYVWLIFVAGGLAVVLMIALQWLLGRGRGRKAPASSSPASAST